MKLYHQFQIIQRRLKKVLLISIFNEHLGSHNKNKDFKF